MQKKIYISKKVQFSEKKMFKKNHFLLYVTNI